MSTSPATSTSPAPRAAIFALGFRPFFLGGSVFAIITMLLWIGVWRYSLPLNFSVVSPSLWHAHELIYGYTVAVIAGFLLTAVRNWTGMSTPTGVGLAALFLCWALARIAFFFGDVYLRVAALFDLCFFVALIVSVALPIVAARQWRQLAILSKLVLLGAGNALFYSGALGFTEGGVRWGVYAGLYLIIGLILVMGRRVIPSFIETGVGYSVVLKNRRWLDLASMALFMLFFVVEVFTSSQWLGAWLAVALFSLHAVRAVGWHTPGIWRKPLLWSLYCAYLFIVSGFALHALGVFSSAVSPVLAVHAFAVGGGGLMTISMMSRVSLGHTGRNVHAAPGMLSSVFVLLVIAFTARVLLPAVDMQHYLLWLLLAALAWVLGFTMFVLIFLPVLVRPRVDGRRG
jgi:uncharacterized protein involved in response to NO